MSDGHLTYHHFSLARSLELEKARGNVTGMTRMAPALGAAVLAVLACSGGGGTDANSVTPPVIPPVTNSRTGVWNGTTDQNLPVHIRVNAAGTIDTLTIRLSATFGGPTCTATIVKTALSVGADDTFETTVGIGFDTPLRGRFTSATTMTGSIDARTGSYGAACGTLVAIGTGSVLPALQWQAQKQ